MKTLYLDVSAGAAGDMLMGALYGLCPDPERFLAAINRLPLPGLSVTPEPQEGGVHMAVTFHGHGEESAHRHHPHRKLSDVLNRIRSFPLPEGVLLEASAVYEALAQAEAKAHGEPVAEIHFHEVGMDDAIADIVGVTLLLSQLSPDRIVASPVAVGGGTVHCAHGELSVPAPATAALLDGIPTIPGPVPKELCTPTGAALLRRFAGCFGTLPAPSGKVSFGYGSRSFPTHRNAVAAWIAESQVV